MATPVVPSNTARVQLIDEFGVVYKATGGGSSVEIQVEGVDNASQTLVNFVSGTPANLTITNPSGGIVQLDVTAAGTGDVVGPASATPSDIVVFNGGTGKLVADGGTTIAAINSSIAGKLSTVTADAPLSGSGTSGSHLVISQSGAATNGYLSSTDWNTFNNKQAAGSYLTAVTADSPLSGSGTSGSHLVIANAAADGTTKGAAAFTASDFDAASGVISIDYTNGQAADATHKGFLTSTDWSTFNAKQPAGNYITALTSDVTASGPGSATATIANQAVTLAKIQNAAASSKLLGSGATGAGSSYAELTLGTNLSMSGTTLNATGGGGTPGGSNTQVQFNDSSAFGGDSGFTYDKTTNTASVDSAIFKVSPWVDVRAFGATGDGTTDDTTAIQNAINSLPAKGGTVFFPIPTSFYKITASLTIGDGTSSAVSTTSGVILQGAGMPVVPNIFTGYPATGGVTIKWVNASGDNMILIKGPLQGWGIKNMMLDGNSQATNAIKAVSAQFGSVENIYIQGCSFAQIWLTTFDLSGYTGVSNVDCLHNSFTNISLFIPDILNSRGILLTDDGAGSFNSDPDYNDFSNVLIQGPGTATNVFFIYLQACDGNNFNHFHLSGTSASNKAIQFDYSVSANVPSDNLFNDIDFGSSAAVIANSGTPSGAHTNRVVSIHGINGQPSNPSLTNLAWGYTASNP